MPDVSVITAVTRSECLPALYRSIAAQPGSWEWIVQLDGPAITWRPAKSDLWIQDPRVSIEANAQPLGAGTTRNRALLRSTAPRIMCIDEDDLIAPHALPILIAGLDGHPECFVAWGATRSFTDHPSQTRPLKGWGRRRTIAAGTVRQVFEDSGHLPVHMGAMLWQRSLLMAAGGYTASSRAIDANPFLTCEALLPHYFVGATVCLHRLHEHRTTRDPAGDVGRQLVHALRFARTHAGRASLEHVA